MGAFARRGGGGQSFSRSGASGRSSTTFFRTSQTSKPIGVPAHGYVNDPGSTFIDTHPPHTESARYLQFNNKTNALYIPLL